MSHDHTFIAILHDSKSQDKKVTGCIPRLHNIRLVFFTRSFRKGVTHPLPLPPSASAKPCVNNISQTVLLFSKFFCLVRVLPTLFLQVSLQCQPSGKIPGKKIVLFLFHIFQHQNGASSLSKYIHLLFIFCTHFLPCYIMWITFIYCVNYQITYQIFNWFNPSHNPPFFRNCTKIFPKC